MLPEELERADGDADKTGNRREFDLKSSRIRVSIGIEAGGNFVTRVVLSASPVDFAAVEFGFEISEDGFEGCRSAVTVSANRALVIHDKIYT